MSHIAENPEYDHNKRQPEQGLPPFAWWWRVSHDDWRKYTTACREAQRMKRNRIEKSRMPAKSIALTLSAAAFLLAQAPAAYHVTHTYTLGGDGSWDYVVPDPPNHRLFIARQTRVMVVDEDSGMLLGEVTGIMGAHGTAIAESSGHGFATSGNDQSVVMFDLKTFKPLSRIPAAEDADAIVYDSPSNRVFTLNGDAHSSTVIDARPACSSPISRSAVNPSTARRPATAWCTRISPISVKSSRSMRRRRRSRGAGPPRPCKQPVSMAIDTVHHRLFSGCRSGLMAVSDYQAGKVVATLPIGMGVDGAGYDAASGNAFASNADGTLTVIHQDTPDRYHVLETVQTPPGSRNMGLDPVNHRVYIVSGKFGPPPSTGRGRSPVLPGSFSLLSD